MAVVLTALGAGCRNTPQAVARETPQAGRDKVLPPPRAVGPLSLEEAITRRRSRREFAPGSLSDEQIAQLAWAAGGITDGGLGLRAAPSAGALFPLELYVLDAEGVWHYEPASHRLRRLGSDDRRRALGHASFEQAHVEAAAVDLVITGVTSRSAAKYGSRAERFVLLEAGHAAQNALLQATSLGLVAVPVGAFDDEEVRRVLGLGRAETPLYILCFGRAG